MTARTAKGVDDPVADDAPKDLGRSPSAARTGSFAPAGVLENQKKSTYQASRLGCGTLHAASIAPVSSWRCKLQGDAATACSELHAQSPSRMRIQAVGYRARRTVSGRLSRFHGKAACNADTVGRGRVAQPFGFCPHRSGRAAFPHPALPESNPRHIRACAHVRVMRGVGRRKRAVRVSNSGQPMRRLFWLRRLRQRSQVRRTSR
jgi:hypothetical protein